VARAAIPAPLKDTGKRQPVYDATPNVRHSMPLSHQQQQQQKQQQQQQQQRRSMQPVYGVSQNQRQPF
jgi:hypothetical protein